MRWRSTVAAALAAALAGVALAGCGSSGSSSNDSGGSASTSPPPGPTRTQTTKVEIVDSAPAKQQGFNPARIYKREAPGVVTVLSVFDGGLTLLGGGGDGAGLGSGFVISGSGEVVTNAHVVTQGEGKDIKRAKEVYVEFGDEAGNKVPAQVVGADPNSDVALLKVDPRGLRLRVLPLGSSAHLAVGEPVAAIGSPFGEPQSLSIGVISALDRSIDSLTGFSIAGAIQTDAAINRGNSGGPLVNARGQVIGINSQIRTTTGTGSGVGFAVPVDLVKRSLGQLRETGTVDYAFLGVTTVPIYPQLAARFHLPVDQGAWVQEVQPDSPAAKADIKAGKGETVFQAIPYGSGGDIITKVDGKPVRHNTDLSKLVGTRRPGETVTFEIYRGNERRTVEVKLGARPAEGPSKDRQTTP